ncbi:uncharacterized protein TNCV_2149991 [Trichonephila clavipes]|nr:uncharacterized protein TNCV_2149991 [Trichonephila clavipes]
MATVNRYFNFLCNACDAQSVSRDNHFVQQGLLKTTLLVSLTFRNQSSLRDLLSVVFSSQSLGETLNVSQMLLLFLIGFRYSCQVIYSQFCLAIHQNDHQARRRFVEWVQNEIAVVPDFHKRIFFSDEAHFWLNGYVNKQNCRIWSEANPQVYVETPLHPEKLTVWCTLWAGGILLEKR